MRNLLSHNGSRVVFWVRERVATPVKLDLYPLVFLFTKCVAKQRLSRREIVYATTHFASPA